MHCMSDMIWVSDDADDDYDYDDEYDGDYLKVGTPHVMWWNEWWWRQLENHLLCRHYVMNWVMMKTIRKSLSMSSLCDELSADEDN